MPKSKQNGMRQARWAQSRRLAPSGKGETFVSVLNEQATQRVPAERFKVNRSTVVHLCRVAK